MKSTANASEISTCVNSGGYILVKLNRQRDNPRSKHYDCVWSGWIPLDPYVSTGTLKVVEGYNLYLKYEEEIKSWSPDAPTSTPLGLMQF